MLAEERFGPNLRRIREQRGISLQEIAEQTNVDLELWAGLERNDLSRWPAGIFARAFVREYARAIGLDPEQTVDEFCRRFPQGDRRREHIVRAQAAVLGLPSEWHDELVPERERRRTAPPVPPALAARDALLARRSRLAAAGLDLLVAGAGGALIARATDTSVLPVIAVTSLAYHAATVALFGATGGSALVAAWLRQSRAAQLRRIPATAFPRLRRGLRAARS